MGSPWLAQWKGGSAPSPSYLPLLTSVPHERCAIQSNQMLLTVFPSTPNYLKNPGCSVMQRMLYVYYYENSQSYRFCCVVYLFDCVCDSQNRITKGLVMSWSFNVLDDSCMCCILTIGRLLSWLDTWLVWLLNYNKRLCLAFDSVHGIWSCHRSYVESIPHLYLSKVEARLLLITVRRWSVIVSDRGPAIFLEGHFQIRECYMGGHFNNIVTVQWCHWLTKALISFLLRKTGLSLRFQVAG